MKCFSLSFLFLLVLLASCRQGVKEQAEAGYDIQLRHANDTISSYKKYDVKSGIITLRTSLKTLSVNMEYKTVISFDHYGMRERRDTYTGDTLTETFLSDGFNNFNISHKNKKIVRTGNAYRGTESRFGWDKIDPQDVKEKKVILNKDLVIAGKKCKSYTILAGVATVTYAGWKHILLLNDVESPGGRSISKAEKVQIIPVDASLFLLPAGYSYNG